MTFPNMPLIIPFLAAGYLLTVYLLLMLAERTTKGPTPQPPQVSSSSPSVE